MLEQTIDRETCCFKVRALRSAVVSESEEHCRNCSKEYELECQRYKPISRSELAFRKGYRAILYFYNKYISIEGLPHEEG